MKNKMEKISALLKILLEKIVINKKSIITVLIGAVIGVFLVSVISSVDFFDEDFEAPSEFVEVTEAGDEIKIEQLEELRGFGDLSSILKNWSLNTSEKSLMQSSDVINFLLIGLDAGNYNSDAIIIASLNKETRKICITSVFRDSYTYIDSVDGGRFAKINACYANGGADKLIETIQNDFKIKIDYYVSVNFDSFSAIVDVLGGIPLDVQEYEASAVSAEIKGYCPSGENVILNGEQALAFCRIRHCDSDADVSRTRRQRQFINSLINESKSLSINQVSPLLNSIIKYVKTDCSVGNIVSLATQAITNKWYDYEIVSAAIPSEDHRMDYRGNAWVWIVDYPAAAQQLQMTIYGKTNITLNDDRVTAIDVMRQSSNTGNANP